MEDKVVSFGKGIHREPSIGGDGELAECVNLWSEGSEMKLLPRMSHVRYVPNGWVSAFVHEGGEEDRLVMWSKVSVSANTSGTGASATAVADAPETGADSAQVVTASTRTVIGWMPFVCEDEIDESDADEVVEIVKLAEGEELRSVNAMGNVLVVSTSVKIYYFLWTEGKYVDYSLDIQGDFGMIFSLSGEYRRDITNYFDGANINSQEAEYNTMIGSVLVSGSKQNKVCNLFTITNEAKKLEKEHWYQIKFKDYSSSYYHYAVFGIKEGDTLNLSEIKIGEKYYNIYDSDNDICIFDGTLGLVSGTPFIKKGGKGANYNRLHLLVNDNQMGTTATFQAKENFDRVFVIITSGSYRCDTFAIYERKVGTANYPYTVDKSDSTNIDTLIGNINKFIHDESVSKGRFMYPFFVRAAVKLKDGRYIKHTPPVLMIPNSGCVPNCYIINDFSTNGNTKDITAMMTAVTCKLEYRLNSEQQHYLDDLKERSELVEGIAIAVSEPIYTYNMGATTKELNESLYFDKKELYNGNISNAKIENISDFSNDYRCLNEETINGKLNITPIYRITLPKTNKLSERILDASTFYVIKEYKLDDIIDNGNVSSVNLDEWVLDGLVSRKRMEDDSYNKKVITADTIYAYNNKLVLGNIKEKLYQGYNPTLMMNYVEKPVEDGDDSVKAEKVYIEVYINKNDRHYTAILQDYVYSEAELTWFYYPDADAKSAKIYYKTYDDDNGGYYYRIREIVLEEHPHLNGAYWMSGLNGLYEEGVKETTDAELKKKIFTGFSEFRPEVVIKNKIIQSYVNNPFVFDSSSVSLVGTGEIKRLISNTKALSQGQFGEHPVLAFCSDGIWALSVSDEGKFLAVQPISRDVLVSADKVVQLDSAVAFVSNKGLMMIEGSTVERKCVQMDGKDVFDSSAVDAYISNALASGHDGRDFVKMLQTASLMYDGENGLVWIYPMEDEEDESGETSGATGTDANASETGAVTASGTDSTRGRCVWAMSVETGEVYAQVLDGNVSALFNTLKRGPVSIVNGYPYSYMQYYTKGRRNNPARNFLMQFKKGTSTEMVSGWLLTRPLSFGDAYTMKMLYDMKVEKMLGEDSSCKVAVYVSNDRVHWSRLKSLKARSYKWYRFAIFCTLNDYDRVTGIICKVDERRGNKIR